MLKAELMGHISSRMSFRTVNEDMWEMSRRDSWEKQPEDGARRVPSLITQSQSHERDERNAGAQIREELALNLWRN